jgi:hypothetical protein
MSDKTFSNELQRALARPDVEQLVLDLDDYRRFHGEIVANDPTPGEYEHDGNFAHVQDPEDSDLALSYLVLAAARYDDAHFLGFMAAGPLEDLLRDPAPAILDRIIAEARKTPRFRWMLSGVYLHAIAEHAREPVNAAINGWSLDYTPMPERPWV